jgi:hypothetical protein
MAIKKINIFPSKSLKICPNFDFWSENIPSGNPEQDLSKIVLLAEEFLTVTMTAGGSTMTTANGSVVIRVP